MARILYGTPIKEKIKEELKIRVKKLEKEPILAIIQVGDREDSNVYIKQKQKFGGEIGIKVVLNKFVNISEEELESEIKKLNKDKNIDGIIVQLPQPKNLNTQKIINTVSVKKDADGLVSKMPFDSCSKKGIFDIDTVLATARGVMALLDFYQIEIKNKKVAVIGQGILAGIPIAIEMEKKGAEVFRCDINTKNIPEITKGCDILISAVGKPGLITKEFINERQVVVDVGINKTSPPTHLLEAGERSGQTKTSLPKLVGDVNYAEVEPLVYAITPVPGGIGPLTVSCLFQNLLDLIISQD